MKKDPASGFTLLEILAALVVLGILLAGLTQATRFGRLASDRQIALVAETADLDAVDRLLRHVVEQADPGDQHEAPPFSGDAAGLAFTSALPLSVAMANHRADMHLLVDGGHRLILRWGPALHAVRTGPPAMPTDIVLLAGVDHLEMSYWPRPETAGTGWRLAWNAPALPALVRIRIVFVGGDRRKWPDIVAATLRERT